MNDAEVMEGLARLGLDEKERRFYLAALDWPGASVTDLSAKAGVARTHGYDLLERLIGRGLLKPMAGAAGKRVVAEDPGVLLSDWQLAGMVLDRLVPLLRSRGHRADARPSVRLYEGSGEVRRALGAFMDSSPAATQLLLGAGLVDACVTAKALQRQLARGRLAGRPVQLLLSSDSAWPGDLAGLIKAGATLRRLPTHPQASLSVLLQDRQAICVVTGTDPHAVGISGQALVAAGRALFDHGWSQAQPVDCETGARA